MVLLLLSHDVSGLPHKEHIGYGTITKPSSVRFFHAFGVAADVLPAC